MHPLRPTLFPIAFCGAAAKREHDGVLTEGSKPARPQGEPKETSHAALFTSIAPLAEDDTASLTQHQSMRSSVFDTFYNPALEKVIFGERNNTMKEKQGEL